MAIQSCTRALILTGVILFMAGASPSAAQTLGFERERGREMLTAIKDDITKNYYDPKFHGVDIDARFKAAEDKIKQATSVGQIQAIIAQALVDFDDSHLFFIPPEKANLTEYGWQIQMIGDKPFIVAVQPGSDAEAQGLKPGDEVYSLDGYEPTRANLWKMQYFYRLLRPRPVVEFVIQNGSKQRVVQVKAKVTPGVRVHGQTESDIVDLIREAENANHLREHRFAVDEGGTLLIWKMPQFDLSESQIDTIMDRARKHKALIVDLRGNGGGAEVTQLRLVGNMFDHDVKIGEIHRRKETKPLVAKSRGGGNVFKGQLVVLVDSESGSSAEIFARVIQLEKRGTIVGDRSAGAVMRAVHYPHESGIGVVAFYGVSVTDADLIMADGKSLEKAGVTPDEIVLPTSVDLAAKRDPVLARAAAILGVKLDAEKAGTLFPIQWKK